MSSFFTEVTVIYVVAVDHVVLSRLRYNFNKYISSFAAQTNATITTNHHMSIHKLEAFFLVINWCKPHRNKWQVIVDDMTIIKRASKPLNLPVENIKKKIFIHFSTIQIIWCTKPARSLGLHKVRSFSILLMCVCVCALIWISQTIDMHSILQTHKFIGPNQMV